MRQEESQRLQGHLLSLKLIFVQAVGLGLAASGWVNAERVCPRAALQRANMSPPPQCGQDVGTRSLAQLSAGRAHKSAPPWVCLWMDPSPGEHHLQTIPLPSVPLTVWEAELLGRKAHAH